MILHTKLLLWSIRLDEIDRIRNLVLFSYSYDEICNKIKHLISGKSSITDSINYNFAKTRINSCNSLPNEKNIDFS